MYQFSSYTNNQKKFWSLVKRVRKNYQPVFYVDDDLKTSPTSKTEARSQQFYSVITKEYRNTSFISSQYPDMPDIVFTTDRIQKLLHDSKPGKSVAPDNISTWIVKVAMCFTNSINPTSGNSNI